MSVGVHLESLDMLPTYLLQCNTKQATIQPNHKYPGIISLCMLNILLNSAFLCYLVSLKSMWVEEIDISG